MQKKKYWKRNWNWFEWGCFVGLRYPNLVSHFCLVVPPWLFGGGRFGDSFSVAFLFWFLFFSSLNSSLFLIDDDDFFFYFWSLGSRICPYSFLCHGSLLSYCTKLSSFSFPLFLFLSCFCVLCQRKAKRRFEKLHEFLVSFLLLLFWYLIPPSSVFFFIWHQWRKDEGTLSLVRVIRHSIARKTWLHEEGFKAKGGKIEQCCREVYFMVLGSLRIKWDVERNPAGLQIGL